MDKNQIIQTLQTEKQHLKENFGVEKIALFGSYAHGTSHSDSDIDLFVEFDKPSYSFLMNLYSYLETKLNAKIEIVRKGPHLSERFLKTIEKDLIYA